MPRGPATFTGPGRAHSQHCQLYFGSVTALYMRACDRSAQGPGFSLGGPGKDAELSMGRVGLGHDFAVFWRVGSGRVSTSDLKLFTDYFLVPEST